MKKNVFISLMLFLCLNALAGLKVATYNIRNFDYDPRYNISTNKDFLKKTIAELDADLLAVQEIVQDRIFTQFIDNHFVNSSVVLTECGGQNDQKLGFVYNTKRLELKKVEEDSSVAATRDGQLPQCHIGSRPALIAQFYDKIDKMNFTAIAVHLKAGGEVSDIQKRFYQISTISKIISKLKKDGQENFIIIGDFNTTEYIQKQEEYTKLIRTFKNMDLEDLSAKVSCTSYWYGGIDDDLEYPSILDHIVISKNFKDKLQKVEVESHCKKSRCGVANQETLGVSFQEVSDHCPLTATF